MVIESAPEVIAAVEEPVIVAAVVPGSTLMSTEMPFETLKVSLLLLAFELLAVLERVSAVPAVTVPADESERACDTVACSC